MLGTASSLIGQNGHLGQLDAQVIGAWVAGEVGGSIAQVLYPRVKTMVQGIVAIVARWSPTYNGIIPGENMENLQGLDFNTLRPSVQSICTTRGT